MDLDQQSGSAALLKHFRSLLLKPDFYTYLPKE